MAMETMYAFMEIPPSCLLCDNSTSVDAKDCVCEHTPVAPLTNFSNFLYYTFSVEYIMRLICFSPLPKSSGGPPTSVFNQFVMFVIHPWQVIDLLAVLPFWLEVRSDEERSDNLIPYSAQTNNPLLVASLLFARSSPLAHFSF